MIINNHKIIIKIINFENFEIIFWNQKPKTPSDGTCLGEPLGGFCVVVHFWCCVSSFIFICWCFSFCWCCISIWFSGYFAMSPALHSGFSDPWRPPPALSSNLDYFWLPLLFHLPPALRFWVGIFYPQAFFTLCSFSTFLAQPVFIKASLGAGSYSLKFAGLHTDPRNTDPVHLFVWFTVIHNLLYILNLYLYMSILQKFYLW